MEMHIDSIVCILTGSDKKPYREYDSYKTEHGRRCSVTMPFDTEYKILVKNLLSTRIRLTIDIDGSNVSGGGLILSRNSSEYIERYVDVAKKFKFVAASHSDVSDPTNPENGLIKVKCYKEKEQVKFFNNTYPTINPYPYPNIDPWTTPCNPYTPMWNTSPTLSYSSKTSLKSVEGATVEGDMSDQTFGTTSWNGDSGDPIVFLFKVVGRENDEVLLNDPEYKKYLELQKKFGDINTP